MIVIMSIFIHHSSNDKNVEESNSCSHSGHDANGFSLSLCRREHTHHRIYTNKRLSNFLDPSRCRLWDTVPVLPILPGFDLASFLPSRRLVLSVPLVAQNLDYCPE